jgi:hypothetical protein
VEIEFLINNINNAESSIFGLFEKRNEKNNRVWKRNETKRNETKRNETKRNETKRKETKRNETKRKNL